VILGSLLFNLDKTTLSTVISISSANHQLDADDIQRLLSFSALDFSHNITHLENTITNVANPSKTEFLIFGLPFTECDIENQVYRLSACAGKIVTLLYFTFTTTL